MELKNERQWMKSPTARAFEKPPEAQPSSMHYVCEYKRQE